MLTISEQTGSNALVFYLRTKSFTNFPVWLLDYFIRMKISKATYKAMNEKSARTNISKLFHAEEKYAMELV